MIASCCGPYTSTPPQSPTFLGRRPSLLLWWYFGNVTSRGAPSPTLLQEDLSVGGMRMVVGDRLYHSPGDPEDVSWHLGAPVDWRDGVEFIDKTFYPSLC